MSDEPPLYFAEHLRDRLVEKLGELDIHVSADGPTIVVTGHVSTTERRATVETLLAELCPDREIRNDTTVTVGGQGEAI